MKRPLADAWVEVAKRLYAKGVPKDAEETAKGVFYYGALAALMILTDANSEEEAKRIVVDMNLELREWHANKLNELKRS